MWKSFRLPNPTFVCQISFLLLLESSLSVTMTTTTTPWTTPTTTTTPLESTTKAIMTTTSLETTTTSPMTTTTPLETTTTSPTTTTSLETTTPATYDHTWNNPTNVGVSTVPVDVLESLAPDRGPVAGGTKVTFRGQGPIEEITNIYFGSAGLGTIINSADDSLTVYSPPAQQSGSVTIDLTFNGVYDSTILVFDYRPNPVIDRILAAPVQLTSGGSLLTVVGSSLDSVVNPQINVTVVLVQPASCNRCRRAPDYTQPYSINSYIGNCTYESSGNMTCVLPDLHLPDNFTSKLQDDRQNEGNFSTTEPGSVAILLGPDGSDAYVYLGFVFDGYRKYENVSDPKSGLQDQLYLNFVPPPVIHSSTDLITFDSKKDDNIQIQGDYLLEGCSYGVLCVILLGDGSCDITQVTDNLITCAPPKEKPHPSPDDFFCRPTRPNSLTIEIHIGLRSYYYRCLDYYFLDLALIIGLTVGLGVPALIAIFVALFFCIRKLTSRKKPLARGRQLPALNEVNTADASFNAPHTSSNPTTISQDPERTNIFQNMRMSMLRRRDADGYSSEIPHDDRPPYKNYVEHKNDDVASQTGDAAPRTSNRVTVYPPDYLRSSDNGYLSNIHDDSRVELSDGVGEMKGSSGQSHHPTSFGKSWANYDNDLSRNDIESEDKLTYANFGELSFHKQ